MRTDFKGRPVTIARTFAALALSLIVQTVAFVVAGTLLTLGIDWFTLASDAYAEMWGRVGASIIGAWAAVRVIDAWPGGYSRRAVLAAWTALSIAAAATWAQYAGTNVREWFAILVAVVGVPALMWSMMYRREQWAT